MGNCSTIAALVLAVSLPAVADSQEWSVIDLGTSADLRALQKTAFAERYVVGDAGFVARSDATQSAWTEVFVGSPADFLAVHEPAANQAWIGGAAGTVRRLVSGMWEARDIPNPAEDFVIFTRTSGWSFAAGTGGSIYRTADGGGTWNLQTSGTTNALRDGNGFGTGPAFAVGDGGTILKTTDGVNWVAKPSGTTADLHAFLEGAGGWLFVAGANGTLLRSTDASGTWHPRAMATTATLFDIDTSGRNANWMLAVGEAGTIRRSTDAGTTWCALDAETGVDLHAVDMATNARYVVAGAGGYLAVSNTSGGGCVAPSDVPAMAATAAALHIAGPWPSPLRGSGHVALGTSRTRHVRADLVDVSGRRVRRLLDGELPAGANRALELDAASLGAGVYFLRVEAGDATATRRIVVVR